MGQETVMAKVISEVSNEVTGPLTSEPEDVASAESLECKAGPAELFLPKLTPHSPPFTISASEVSVQEHSPGKSSLLLLVDPLRLCCASPCGSRSDSRAPTSP